MKNNDDPVQQVVLADTCGQGNGPAVPERAVLAEVPLAELRRRLYLDLREARRMKRLAKDVGSERSQCAVLGMIAALLDLAETIAAKPRARGTGENDASERQRGGNGDA